VWTLSKRVFQLPQKATLPAVKAVAATCREVTVAALCRTSEQDVARAAEALAAAAHPRIHTFVATSDIHLEHKLKKSRREVLDDDALKLSNRRVRMLKRSSFPAEDATRSDPEYLFEVLDTAVEAGAKVLNVPDTVGYTTPVEFAGPH
jgi:2-isopropylmalate synthase